jgi:glucosamine--fructose-6-phosphate aminotransferase (isomerizing)
VSMLSEIEEQPAALARLLDTNRAIMAEVAVLAEDVTHVVIAARGTSDNAARYAQYVWGARNRLAVGLTTPSLFGPLASPPSLDGALVVGISQSGESPDLVEVLAEAARQNRPTLAITNAPDSPLADQAGCVVDLCAGPERAVAATKSYSAQLAAVALCSLAFSGEHLHGLEHLPERMGEAVETSRDLGQAVEALEEADRCVVVGRGYQLATVYEWALKLQELTYLLAQPLSAADFLHGPVAVVEAGFPLLVVATAGPTYQQMGQVADDMMAKGAQVITLADVASAPGHVRISVPRVEPWLSPIVSAPALQSFTHALAVTRHIDPDSPRGLSKVTRTR